MPNNKGFNGWIEIFKGGKQRDSKGREHDGDALIDRAIASFNAADHEPPAVIGHPKDTAPAWAWAEDLKKEGNVLMAKFRDVVPEFADMVERGMFKKRSAAFYPDGRLRHIGFLGAVPPAVKGLADIGFSDEADVVVFEFGEEAGLLARVFRRLRDYLIESKGRDIADQVIPDWEIEELQDMARRPQPETADVPAFSEPGQGKQKEDTTMAEDGKNFTEADIKTAEAQAAAGERKKVEAEFAEQQKKDDQAKQILVVADFCEEGVKNGMIAPAWIDGGLKEFMEALVLAAPIEFKEGDGKPPLDWFREFLEGLPKLIDFSEIATRDSDVNPDNQDAEDIARRASEFQESEAKAGRTISVTQAVAHVTGKQKT